MQVSDFITLLATHQWSAASAGLVLALFTIFSNRTTLPTWNSPFRPILATVFGVLGPTIDTAANHGNWQAYVIAQLAVVFPTLWTEISIIFTKPKVENVTSFALVTEAKSRGISIPPTAAMFPADEPPTKPARME
jgi:hypothetical protein